MQHEHKWGKQILFGTYDGEDCSAVLCVSGCTDFLVTQKGRTFVATNKQFRQ